MVKIACKVVNPFLDARELWNRLSNLRNPKLTNFPSITKLDRVITNTKEISTEFLSSDDAFSSNVIAPKQHFDMMSSNPTKHWQH